MSLTYQQVVAALRTVIEPELVKDIVTLGMVKNVKTSDNDVDVTIELTSANPTMKSKIETDVTAALDRIGAGFVKVTVDAPNAMSHGAKPASGSTNPPVRDVLPQVKHVIAVGAGKGGVGKSTIAVNVAVGLQRRGHRVGLMDGDIYGPSMPTMLGLAGQTPGVADLGGQKYIRPLLVHGIHAITIGSLVEADKPLMWRGPMAHGAFKQLLVDNTKWPELDYLIVDLPPGTGDVPITLCQLLPLTGAIIVATPQQVALDDAIRAARMFQQLGAPILGVVENMSYFVDPAGNEHDIFGRGGAAASARRLGLNLLAEIPMYTDLRVNSDAGKPHANFEKNTNLSQILGELAEKVEAEVTRLSAKPGIELEIE